MSLVIFCEVQLKNKTANEIRGSRETMWLLKYNIPVIPVPSRSLAMSFRWIFADIIGFVSYCFVSQVLQAIPSVIIVAFHLAPKIATMTPTRAIVPLPIKVLGGTKAAIIQTLTVCTSMVRWVLKEWRGTTGRIPTTLSRDRSGRFVQRTSNVQCTCHIVLGTLAWNI